MKNSKITICDANIHPGEVANLAMPLPDQYTCAPVYMPIKVINGVNKGPCVLMFSAVRGDELNGIEIINRVIEEVDVKKLSGTLITIPVLNVHGLIHSSSDASSDLLSKMFHNSFPGDSSGSFEQRIAHLFTNEILKMADYCIELQTGSLNHNILPQVYCNFLYQESKRLAESFQAPVITNVTIENNALRKTAEELDVSLLVYQAGEALRFDEDAINFGVQGVVNVMQHLQMLPGSNKQDISPVFSQDVDWLVAHKSGILYTEVTLGQKIKKGDKVGHINDPFLPTSKENIYADQDGIVVGINTTPLIHEGTSIFKIASFLDDNKAESLIEKWDETQDGSFIT